MTRRRVDGLKNRPAGKWARHRGKGALVASRPSRISTRPKNCAPENEKGRRVREAELSVSIKNLYNFLKSQGLNVFTSQAPHCRQVHDSLSQGQKTARPRGPKRSPGRPSGGFWGVPGRRPRRARNDRGGVFAWKSLHFLHEDDFPGMTPFLKFCEKVMDED